MTARITQQIVEILGAGSSKARVTHQIVEVLGDIHPYRSGADALELSDAASGDVVSGGGEEGAANNPLVLYQVASFCVAFARAAEGVLALADAADAGIIVTQELELTDAALFEHVHGAADALEFSDAATCAHVVVVSVTDALDLADATDKRGPVYAEVGHFIPFGQPANGHVGTVNVAVGDTLGLLDQVGRTFEVASSNTLALIVVGCKCNAARDILAFVETATAGKSRGANNVVTLVQELVLEALLSRSVVDSLGLVHSGTYQLVGPACVTHQYQPFVGFSTDATISPPDVVAPALGDATLTLTYPFVAPTHTVVLRNPEFSNKDRLNFNRINRQTRGGTLVVYADANWPKTQTLQVEVRGLKAAQAVDLLAFLGESLGKEVGLLDHENRQWRGIITDPDTPVANPSRGDLMVSFTFEGELC